MATVYYHAQIGVVTDEGDVNVIYPLNMAEDVTIEPNVSAPNITNLQALINALGSYAFKNTIIDDNSTTSTTETWSASKINSQILNGIGEHLTEDEYNALSPAERNAGTYFVDDVNAEPVLIDQTLDATSGNPVANAPVATAINQINSDLTESIKSFSNTTELRNFIQAHPDYIVDGVFISENHPAMPFAGILHVVASDKYSASYASNDGLGNVWIDCVVLDTTTLYVRRVYSNAAGVAYDVTANIQGITLYYRKGSRVVS